MKLISVIFTLILVVSCNQTTEEKTTKVASDIQSNEIVVEKQTEKRKGTIQQIKTEPLKWQQARVKYLNLEGGFYGLITHSGNKYLPMNLDKSFQQDGAIVNIQGNVEHNVMTIQQWGKPYKISNIKLIKAGRVKVPESDK